MDKMHTISLCPLVVCLLFLGVSMAAEKQNVPVIILPPEKPQDNLSAREREASVKLVRSFIQLDAPESPYGQTKVNVLRGPDGKIRRLVVYLLHRDTYLLDIVQLTIDDDFHVVGVDKSPW